MRIAKRKGTAELLTLAVEMVNQRQ